LGLSFKTSFVGGIILVVALYIVGAVFLPSTLRSAIRLLLFNEAIEILSGVFLLVSLFVAMLPRDSEFSKGSAGFIAGIVISGYIIGIILTL
jgi:hypothetical protein